MSYIVFARKYRPQTFDEIIGQSHITTTLKNAISQNRVAHAYIFAGPRGVGKTTTARILAKALNCEKGPAPQPCNACVSCNEITQGSSLDILEIDGASNRGIDEIRNLKENVKFAPSKGRFKVYIIDEVHMLTAEAFNALLKTLEEPPPHVKFVFATTQVNKVPPTILSRCQRFDFRRIAVKDIFNNLKEIAKKEGLNAGDESLAIIAKYSDGSMRDGQVILDQMISFTEGRIEAEDVVKILGLIGEDVLFGLSGAIRERDPAKALKAVDDLISEGKDVSQIVSGLIEHFRNLAVVKVSDSADPVMDAEPDKLKRYKDEARKFTVEEILYCIYTFSNTIDFIRKSNLARVPLEAALVKLTRKGSIVPLAGILDKIKELEARLVAAGKARQIPAPAEETVQQKTPQVAKDAPAPENTSGSADIESLLTSWGSVISHVKKIKISVGSYLEEGYPVSLESNTLSVGIPKEFQFHKEMLEYPDNRRMIEEAMREVLKVDLKIKFTLVEPVNLEKRMPRAEMTRPEAPDDDTQNMEEPLGKKEVDPLVKMAMDVFGGKVVDEDKKGISR